MLKLQFLDGSRDPMWLVNPKISIGSENADVMIKAAGVEPLHAELLTQDSKLFLVDKAGKNNVEVNGQAVTKYGPIKEGDSLTIAGIKMKFIDSVSSAEAAPATFDGWSLEANGDWLKGQSFEIKGEMVLGRDTTCDIVIPGTHLSRRHAKLVVIGKHVEITDLDSSNGTYVNGKKVESAKLVSGDKVQFDVLKFVVKGPVEDVSRTVIRPSVDTATMLRAVKEKQDAEANAAAKAPQQRPKPTSVGNRDDGELHSVKKSSQVIIYTTVMAVMIGLGAAVYFLVLT